MGEFADAVNDRLRDRLAALDSTFDWETEHYIAGTPVDVAGVGADALVCLELEWRRADPADNTAKLFRHLSEEAVSSDRVHVFQVFTAYYDLASGGVSAKRKNAEFVGRVAARTFPELTYEAVELNIDPPKRDGPRPDGWRTAVDAVAGAIATA